MKAIDELRNMRDSIKNAEENDLNTSQEELIKTPVEILYNLLLNDLKNAIEKKRIVHDTSRGIFSNKFTHFRYEVNRDVYLTYADYPNSKLQLPGNNHVNTSVFKTSDAGSEEYGYTFDIWTTDISYINIFFKNIEDKFKNEGIDVLFKLHIGTGLERVEGNYKLIKDDMSKIVKRKKCECCILIRVFCDEKGNF